MTQFKTRLLASTVVGGFAALAALTPSVAAAQTSPGAAAQEQQQQDAAETDVQEVVVVGSRIRRDAFNSPSPIQVITREETTLAGFASTTEALQNAAVTGGGGQINNAFGGFVTDGGPGANTLSLRGLGAGRTLVLINGRRVSPAGTRGGVASADLNVLPNAIIDRVDILRDGASSIYGSDAIAGVVNVVTRRNLDGLEFEGQISYPTNGAGQTYRAALVGGLSGDRWRLGGSLEYFKREALTLGDRDWTLCNTDYRFNPETRQRTDFIDPATGQPKCYPITGTGANGVTINTVGTSNAAGVGAPGSVGTTFNRWRPNAAVTTGVAGFEGVGGGANNLNVRDTFDPRMLNRSLISPAQIYTAFGQASYDLQALGNAEVYAELLHTRRESQQTGFRQYSLDYRRFLHNADGSVSTTANPLIPEALRFSNFSADQGISGGQRVGVRAFIGFGNDRSEQTVDFTKATTGLRGDLGVLPDWRYDLTYTYSRSAAEYRQQSFLTDKVTHSTAVVAAPAGMDPALVRNGYTCLINLTNPAERCILAPALTAAVIGGELPQDYVNYVFRTVTGTTDFDEHNVAAYVDGPLFSLPAGRVQGAFGMEFRRSEIDDTPDVNSINRNLYNLTSSAITRGTDSVWEAYGEVEAPILRDLPFAQNLTLTGSVRYTNYDSYGEGTTYKAGVFWRPIDWLSFRVSQGTSFRAPALSEQFQGATSGFLSSAGDPCNNYGAPGVNPNRAANCAQELPGRPDFQATTSIAVITQGGREAGLFAETSENFTAGVVFQPRLPEGYGRFDFAVDYFDIKIEDGVDQVGASNILQRCYDNPQFRAGGGFCRLVERDATSGQLTVQNAYTNVATQVVEGLDYNIRYAFDVGAGEMRLNGRLTQYLSQASRLFSDDPMEELNGTLNNPEWTGSFSATLALRPWQFRYGVDWIQGTDSYEYLGLERETSQFVFHVPDYWLHNASVRYSARDWSVVGGVRNLFDTTPPQISSGAYNRVGNSPLYSGYDYVGRTVFVNVSKAF